jgi:hypothetical protein
MVGNTGADIATGKAAVRMALLVCHPGSFRERLQGISAGRAVDGPAGAAAALAGSMSETN